MTAREVKEALRGRHAATDDRGFLGPWTCLEEFAQIDFLAFSAWSSRKPPIVGYEVKVSRGDYRRELLKPSKRARAVAGCWEFYMATPAGLLKPEEKAWHEPEHFSDGGAFIRERCSERPRCRKPERHEHGMSGTEGVDMRLTGRVECIEVAFGEGACWIKDTWKGKRGEEIDLDDRRQRFQVGLHVNVWRPCRTCEGRGYLRKSVVEEEAPTLWVPRDVGLVEVRAEGRVHTVRKAPRSEPTRELGPIGAMVRWASFRPDPRHEGIS